MLAILGLVGSLLGLLYPLLPGAQISTGEEFIFPFSLFVLIGSIGGFVALLLIGIAILRPENCWNRWRTVPVIVALMPLPLIVDPNVKTTKRTRWVAGNTSPIRTFISRVAA